MRETYDRREGRGAAVVIATLSHFGFGRESKKGVIGLKKRADIEGCFFSGAGRKEPRGGGAR